MCAYLLFSTSYFSPLNFRLLFFLEFVLDEFHLSLPDIQVKYLAGSIL